MRFPDTSMVDFPEYFPSSIAFLHIEKTEYFLRKKKSHLRVHSLLTNSLEICGQAKPCFPFETETAIRLILTFLQIRNAHVTFI